MRQLSTGEITRMRSTQATAMNTTCTIQRVSQVADGAGGSTDTWSTLASNVACRIMKATIAAQTSEQVAADILRGKALYYVTIPAGQDVTNKDRIVSGGRTFEVVQVAPGVSAETARHFVCAEIS